MFGLMYNNYKEQKANNKEAQTKGVGGFRPVVDWRHIAIQRRTVVDKNVIIFILVCGVFIIIVGIVVLILGLFVIKSECPQGWSGSSSLGCLRVAEDNGTYDQAHEYCSDQDAVMPPLYNDQQNTDLTAVVSGRTWLSLQRPSGTSKFVWTSSGIDANLSQWSNQPSTTSNTYDECVQIDSQGKWHAVPCSTEAFVACSFTPGLPVFVLVGPVVIGCGVIVLILSIEVCVRRRQFYKKNGELLNDWDDPDKDDEEEGVENPGFKDPVTVAPGTSSSWPVKFNNKTAPIGGNSGASSPADFSNRKKHSTASLPILNEDETLTVVRTERLGTSKSLPVPSNEENSQSQEQLELILSPKGL